LTLPGRDTAVQVFDADGVTTADTDAVLELVRDHEMVLATGHLSPDEVDRFTARAIAIGCRRIISTHPDLPLISMPVVFCRSW